MHGKANATVLPVFNKGRVCRCDGRPDMMRRDRIGPGMAALLWQATILYGLYLGLVVLPGSPARDIAAVYITPITPAAVPERRPAQVARPKARAAPPARRAVATAIVVPPPILPPLVIPSIVTAPIIGVGVEPVTGGAAAGAGTGAAGAGDGSGSSDAGEGSGGGGTPARWLRGRITDRDYPREAIAGQIQGTLVTRYGIGANGRVDSCTIVSSSGSALLDTTTCRLVRQRFRYSPARDAAGRKVPDVLTEDHAWVMEPAPREAMTPADTDVDQPITATKICASPTSPVLRSTTTGTVSPA